MNQRPTQITRFHIIAALSLALLCVYLVVLFNIQVVHHEDYLAQSIQTITRVENVKASRGIITDRSGRTLVSNQYTYSLTFDPTLLRSGEDRTRPFSALSPSAGSRASRGRITSPCPSPPRPSSRWTALRTRRRPAFSPISGI